MGSPANSSADFYSASFDRALAQLPLTPLEDSPVADRHEVLPTPDWLIEEKEVAALEDDQADSNRKRKRPPVDTAVDELPIIKNISQTDDLSTDHPAYAASKFGGIGAYLRNKREKLLVSSACAIGQSCGSYICASDKFRTQL
jgi:hypothetical protein